MTQELINYVKNNPEVESVFFKDENPDSWTLQPSASHPIEVSREDVLAADGETEEIHTKKLAADVIAAINTAETLEEAEEAAEGDNRVTVVKALEAKKATFA